MAWRKGHGNGAGQPRIEVSPPNELPAARPRDIGRGGNVKVQLARKLMVPTGDATWLPYAALAEQFRKAQCKAVARQAGGRCGIAPSSIIASAALQLALSRWMLDKAVSENDPGMVKMATTIMNDSRQNLMAAYELAVREAQAKEKYERSSPHVALEAALSDEGSRGFQKRFAPGNVGETHRVTEIVDAPVDVPTDK